MSIPIWEVEIIEYNDDYKLHNNSKWVESWGPKLFQKKKDAYKYLRDQLISLINDRADCYFDDESKLRKYFDTTDTHGFLKLLPEYQNDMKVIKKLFKIVNQGDYIDECWSYSIKKIPQRNNE